MPPAPNREHQDLVSALKIWLELHWAKPEGGRVHWEVNVATPGGWPDKDYRIPDLILLTPDRFAIDHNEYFEGPPLVIVEIHSPGDEAYEKLEFYAKLGVPEVWVIHRDTKVPRVYLLHDGEYRQEPPTSYGWTRSPATGILVQDADGELDIQRGDDTSTRRALSDARSAF